MRLNCMANIDRGGFTWPTDLLVTTVVQCIIVFKCLVSQTHAAPFNLAKNLSAIMLQLSQRDRGHVRQVLWLKCRDD